MTTKVSPGIALAALSLSFAYPVAAEPFMVEAKPGESLAAVRDRVRSLPEDVRRRGVEISIPRGDYVLDDTLFLDMRDSGLSWDAPVVWRGTDGSRITGGVRVPAARFHPVADADILAKLPRESREKVLVADVSAEIPQKLPEFPSSFSSGFPTPLVFLNHAFAVLARWPNEGYASFSRGIDKGSRKESHPGVFYGGAFVFDDPRAGRWDFKAGVWLNGYWTHDWNNASVRAGSWGVENGRSGVIRLSGGVPYGVMSGTWGRKERRFYAFNMVEELDAPGEWWLDRTRKLLYVVPPDGSFSPADEMVLARTRRPLVKSTHPVSHVAFENITFEYSAGDGLVLSGTNIQMRNCRVMCCGGCGVMLEGSLNAMRGCEVGLTGGCGVRARGGDRKGIVRSDSVFEGNFVHDFSMIMRTYAPGFQVGGCGITVRGNRICEAPHSAVIYGGNEHLFESNDVYHVLKETGDAGAFYTGRDWTTQGNVLRYNRVHDLGIGTSSGTDGYDTAVSGDNTMGFYFDDCDCGDAAYGNVFHKVARGIMVGGGRDHPVCSNVFSRCNIGLSIDCRGMKWKKWNMPGGSWDLEGKAKALDYTNGVWRAKYPRLANIMNDHPREPLYNPVIGNTFIDCKQALRLDALAPLERMAPIRDNVIVNTGAGVTEIDPRIADGFRSATGR